MRTVRGVRAAAEAAAWAVVSYNDSIDLDAFAARLSKARKRPANYLTAPAALPLPLLALAACGSGGGAAPGAPQVAAPTLAPVAPAPTAAGQAGSSLGNVLPAASQSGSNAATVTAFSEAGGTSGTVGQALSCKGIYLI